MNITKKQNALAVRAQNGDRKARDELLETMEKYISTFCRSYMGFGKFEVDDWRQELRIAIMNSIDAYDVEKGNFAGFASFAMLGATTALSLSNDYALPLPKSRLSKKLRFKAERAYSNHIKHGLSHSESIQKTAEETGRTFQEIDLFLCLRHQTVDVYDSETQCEDEGADKELATKRMIEETRSILSTISETSRQLFHMRYEEDMKNADIADRLNKTQKDVEKLFAAARQEIRDECKRRGIDSTILM